MRLWLAFFLLAGFIAVQGCLIHEHKYKSDQEYDGPPQQPRPDLPVAARQGSCVDCHGEMDSPSMHPTGTVHLACVDCHGGKPEEEEKEKAHVQPRHPELWAQAKAEHGDGHGEHGGHGHGKEHGERSSAWPERLYTKWNSEDPAFIRFVNPGDLRVAGLTCGGCHPSEVRRVRKSMMAHGAMLWGAALYNNGIVPYKNPRHGEAYGPDGTPLKLVDPDADPSKGQLKELWPLPRFEIGQPGNMLRVFERGGRFPPALPGLTNPLQEPGKPDKGLSPRGLGTLNRTDPVWLGLQKTRLLDPLLYFPGTNDHPGDYRGSGCTACHVLYANDRDPAHSGPIAKYGNRGRPAPDSKDEAFDEEPERRAAWLKESGHPIRHEFTKAIPSSQCIVCHVHPGTTVTNTYLGTLWWDNETEGRKLYPKKQRYPTEKERLDILSRNPEEAGVRGLWSDYDFLQSIAEHNDEFEKVQFADFHGHGWLFRNVYKRDLEGNLLDEHGEVVSPLDPEKFKKAVHLKDIHLEKGMHCVDCHFEQDSHGDGHLYGSVRDAIEIACEDCHGTIREHATLRTSGPAAPEAGATPGEEPGTDLAATRTPWKKRRFFWKGGKLYQRSSVYEDREPWVVPQIKDGGEPGGNRKSWLAKTIQRDNETWGDGACPKEDLAHDRERMTCFSCHSSWMASCFGCHLPMRANQRKNYLHNEGDLTRNYTPYNWQTIRADTYMLGIDGDVTGNRIAPARSACAVLVGSQNANREWVYSQQQTVSAEGFSGVAFSTHVPHTVRKTETKNCTDCHLSKAEDNNALMAQLLMQGTGFMNFMFRWVYVGEEDGVTAVVVTEREEPQAVIGSTLHRDAFPDFYKAHQKHAKQLPRDFISTYHHHSERANDVQLRGEYLYIADGRGGFRIFDVAQIDQKGFSERITTAPISPLDQRFFVKSKNARSIASPATVAVDPTRTQYKQNKEQARHLLYAFLYVADEEEGLIMTTAASLLDGNPRNNEIKRFRTFNPDGLLDGARHVTVAGRFVYVGCDQGLVVVDVGDVSLDDPEWQPKVVATFEELKRASSVQVQFRYAFVTHEGGLSAVDITPNPDGTWPEGAKVVSTVDLPDARAVYLARTYAYVAAGKDGLVIVDVENPTAMLVDQRFTAGGVIDDTNDVQLGITYTSLFAYLADGKNGLRIVQLTSPERVHGVFGFSPRPDPQLVATFKTKSRALSVSRGLDRDRGVDESGNQLTVFNRVGARPFTFEEMTRFYRLPNGKLFRVEDITHDNLDELYPRKPD